MRKRNVKIWSVLIWMLFGMSASTAVLAQNPNDIKIMCYNLLTFPVDGGPDLRFNDLGIILDHYEPDLFLVQELLSNNGLKDISSKCNDLFEDEYTNGAFVSQISNPTNDWKLQQNLVYNDDKFDLVDQQTLVTTHRDINYFALEVTDPNHAQTDPLLLHVYVNHLKASRGFEEEQKRLEMVNTLFDHLEDLPDNSNIIVAGDFNIYESGEPAYIKLLSENGNNTLNDPINKPNWQSHRDIMTQSTRTSPPSGAGGAGGGMDDRFDFVLLSNSLVKTNHSFSYIPETYKAYGNNGTCYNQNITDCNSNNDVSSDVLSALYKMSDHLPVVLSLGDNTSTSTNEILSSNSINIFPNPTDQFLTIDLNSLPSGTVEIINFLGQTVHKETLNQSLSSIDLKELNNGIYFLRIYNTESKTPVTKRFVKF